jgi:GH25 family lysozyme M1 (1,4-beta-N-acetylmuramidase)
MLHRGIITAAVAVALAFGSVPASAAPERAAAPGLPGFDIAHGDIDWKGVKAAGATFVFIAATEGTSVRNPDFARLSAGAYRAGLVRGASHFAVPSASTGAAQADYFVAGGGAWTADHQTLPGVLDIEYNPYGATCYGLSRSAMTAWISGFVTEYRARTGRWPIIYTTPGWWNQCVGNAGAFGVNDPLWTAGYGGTPPLPDGWTTYAFWQYAAAGPFPGGQDVFNGSLDRLVALADNA